MMRSFQSRFLPCPFIKWVGGKAQLLDRIVPKMPWLVKGTYYEPFLGGGAVFFEMVRRGRITKAILSDTNRELINTYRVVKNRSEQLLMQLRYYDELPDGGNRKDTYYEIRDQNPENMPQVNRAARFIYLNLYGYNGLYRENKEGKFNVPFGAVRFSDGNSAILSSSRISKIRSASKALSVAELRSQDFEASTRGAGKDDLVYFDPPYDPVNKTSNFTTYSKKAFLKKSQERLQRLFLSLSKTGAKCLLSSSDTPFMRGLYESREILTLSARRGINSNVGKRGPVNEILVM